MTLFREDLNGLIKRLPTIPGIHGKEEFFNSAVLLLLIMVDDEYHIVFQKRSKNIRQGGEICFPGGKHDKLKDIDYEMTAIRETVEELGIPEEKINVIGRLDTIIALMGQTIDTFIGTADVSIEEMNICIQEVEKVFSIPVSYFENIKPDEFSVMVKAHPSYVDEKTGNEIVLLPSEELDLPENYRKPWGNFKYKVLVYKTDEGVIWGITSRIINDFISKLRKEKV